MLLLGIPVAWVIADTYRTGHAREVRQRYAAELLPYGQAVENALNRRLALIEGFRAFVETEGGLPGFRQSFEVFAFGLQTSAAGIRALQIIDGSVVTHVFPASGSEGSLGFDLRRHPTSRLSEAADRAVEERRTVVLGPFQSGEGARLTVMQPYAAPDPDPAGLVAILLDVAPIVREAGLEGAQDLRIVLSAATGPLLFGDSAVFEQDPVDHTIALPDGAWRLAATPADGWSGAEPGHALWIGLAAYAFTALVAALAWLIASRQSALSAAVEERTRSLTNAYEELQRQIASRERVEAQLLQSQKMEGIGRLAGGIAHDFNNLLTAILGYTALIRGGLRAADPLTEDVAEVEKAARRAADLTRQLLAFARKQVVAPRVLLLNHLVGNLQRMLDRLIGPHVMLETDLAPDLGPIRADAGQLEQVVTNLVVNARDAMPQGGTVRLVTRNLSLTRDSARAHGGLLPGEYVRLDVIDSGEGMDAATLGRVFEPFFTTKDKGGGTGLGLATAYGIVRQAGGVLVADSRRGAGSTFSVLLPRVDEAPGDIEITPQLVPAATGEGTETVLVVDDEEVVRDIAVRALRSRGYQVLTATDGIEARSVAGSASPSIEVLVTDLQMPGLTGRELALELRAHQPGLRVLFMSGRLEAGDGKEDARGVGFLPKPFTPRDLVAAVRSLLDRDSAG